MANKIQFKRGLKTNLPSSADAGMPLWCTDTKELYIGTGNGISKVGGSDDSSGSGSSSGVTAQINVSYDSENQMLIFGTGE
jgi:hypothetical protein